MKPFQYNQQTHKTREFILFPVLHEKNSNPYKKHVLAKAYLLSSLPPPFFTASSSVATILGTLTNTAVMTFNNIQLLYCQTSTSGHAQGRAIQADNHADSIYSADSVFATFRSYRIQKTKILKPNHRIFFFLFSLLFLFLQTCAEALFS